MSTIFATRRGFLYQDKFVVLSFLNHLISKSILEIYIDYPFNSPGQRSMDLRLLFSDGDQIIERVFSIKTGESYKNDMQTTDSTQIKESFEELKIYDTLPRTISTQLEMILVISPPLKGRISDCWTQLKKVEGKSIYVGEAKIAIDWLYTYLGMAEFPNERDMFGFLKKIKIMDSYSDSPDSHAEEEAPLDDMIIRKIQKLIKELGAHSSEYQLPTDLLMYQMIHACQKNAGTGTDIVPILTDILIRFCTQRLMINTNGTGKFEKVYEDVQRMFETWKKSIPVVIPPSEVPVIAESPEGETIT